MLGTLTRRAALTLLASAAAFPVAAVQAAPGMKFRAIEVDVSPLARNGATSTSMARNVSPVAAFEARASKTAAPAKAAGKARRVKENRITTSVRGPRFALQINATLRIS